MGHERELLNLLLEDHVFPLDWASEFSPEICVTAKSDTIAPSTPTGLVATGKLEGIEVRWTNPTTNADGTTCTDLWYVRVYYASKATHDAEGSIDIDNSDTYDGNPKFATEEWTHPVAAGAQYYYVVTAIDNTGNESIASSEVNATGLTVGESTNIPDDATGLILDDVAIGDGILVVVTHVPTTTWVGFSHYRLWYSVKNGSWGAWVEIGEIGNYGYTHKNLDKTKVYKYKATVVGEGTDNESSTADELDNGGAGYQPNAEDNSAIGTILIAAQTIVGTREVRAPNITCDNLAAINADLGAVTAGSIVVGAENKIWLNEGADGKLAIGGATKATAPFRVAADGSTILTDLTATGVFTISATSSGIANLSDAGDLVTVNEADVDALALTNGPAEAGADVTADHDCGHPGDYTSTIINGGLITTGTISLNDGVDTKAGITAIGEGDANIRFWAGDTYANRATADFRVTQGGAVTCANLTVTGGSWGGDALEAAKIPNLDTSKLTTGVLVVARTQAKCTDALADQTSVNTAADAAAYTGASIGVANTDAKCTDALADQTSAHNCAHPGDYTATIINGGLITTGTISFNDGSVTKAGMTAVGAGDANIRIWAGATFASRASAPFRVTQGGVCYATEFQTLTDTGGTAVISGGAFLGALAHFEAEGTKVYDGAAPTTWTTLDLSGIVGSNHALVVLLVVLRTNYATNYAFSWASNDIYLPSQFADTKGCNAIRLEGQKAGYVMVLTDSSGAVHWRADGAENTHVHLDAYLY